MPTESPFLDQFARLMTEAGGAAQGLCNELDGFVKSRLDKLADDMNLVKRDEFEAVKALAAEARAENEALKQRIAELERRLQM